MPLQEPEHVLDMQIELSHGKFALEDAFDLRMKAIQIGNASEALWSDISDEHRQILIQIFRRALEVMHSNVDKFLPNIVTKEGNDLLNMRVDILLSEIEEQVEIIVQANEFEREATRRAMIAELLGEIEPLPDDQFRDFVAESLKTGVHIPAHAVERLLDMATPEDDAD